MKQESGRSASRKQPSKRGKKTPRPTANPQLNGTTPIYVQLIVHFRQQIESGKWAIDNYIPPLDQLADEYGVARATVRQALELLQREGLIVSRHGRGVLVVRKPAVNLWFHLPNSWDELVEDSDRIQRDVFELATFVKQSDFLDSEQGMLAPKYYVVRRILRRDGIPYSIGVSHTDIRIVDEIGESSFSSKSLYRVLDSMRRSQISRAFQVLTVATADAELAYLLGVPLDSPIVNVARSVYDLTGTLIYRSEGQFRSDFVKASRHLLDIGK